MKHFLRLLPFVILFSFFMGAYWGFYKIEQQSNTLPEPQKSLQILTLKGMFDRKLSQEFEAETQIRILIREADNEHELLDKLFAQDTIYDLVYITSFHARPLLGAKFFKTLDKSMLPNLNKISPDFRQLDFDPDNDFLVPLQWGINGFLYNEQFVKKPPETVKDLFAEKKYHNKIGLLPSALETLSVMKKSGLALDDWIRTEKVDLLRQNLKRLKAFTEFVPQVKAPLLADTKLWFVQSANGPAQSALMESPNWKYYVPSDKSTLWVSLIGVGQKSPNSQEAHEFINYLLSSKGSQALVQHIGHASTNSSLNRTESIGEMQKPSYIRKVQLNRIELIIDHQAYEPAWKETLN